MTSTTPLAVFKMDYSAQCIMLQIGGTELRLAGIAGLTSNRGHIDFILAEFASKVNSAKNSLDPLNSLAKAVRYLDHEMTQYLYGLASQRSDLVHEIRQRFRRLWLVEPQAARPVPVVEVHDHNGDFLFPFELLPIFDGAEIESFVNYVEAETALRRFLGFGAVVRRVGPNSQQSENLRASPQIPVQLFTYDMPGVTMETRHIKSLAQLEVEGPWPGAKLNEAEAIECLIDALYDPTKALSGQTRDGTPVQIQHFACHCETDNRTDAGYTLVLGDPDRELKVTLGSIRVGFSQRTWKDGLIDVPRPLVIANACSSGKVDKVTLGSFQKWFVNNHHRGFVGTETAIESGIAAEFAKRLYEELLRKRTLGEAVVHARCRLLAERGSPFGLLYVLYGDPALSVIDDSGEDRSTTVGEARELIGDARAARPRLARKWLSGGTSDQERLPGGRWSYSSPSCRAARRRWPRWRGGTGATGHSNRSRPQ